MTLAKESHGVERGHGSAYFANASWLTNEKQSYWRDAHFSSSLLIKVASQLSDTIKTGETVWSTSEYSSHIQKYRKQLLYGDASNISINDGSMWFDNMTLLVNKQLVYYEKLSESILSRLTVRDFLRVVCIIIVVIACVISPIELFFVTKIFRQVMKLAKQNKQQVSRIEHIVNQIVPPCIAHKLLKQERIEPQHFDCISIFLSDFVNFTQISSACTPEQVFNLIDAAYKMFDACCDEYQCLKIETVGDAYIVASGLPEPCKKHASEIADLAIEIKDKIKMVKDPRDPLKRKNIEMRVGLHTGSVVAGVCGDKMPRYCLIGEAITTANALESTAEPMRIHCSVEFVDRIRAEDSESYEIAPREPPVEILGRGIQTTFILHSSAHVIGVPHIDSWLPMSASDAEKNYQ